MKRSVLTAMTATVVAVLSLGLSADSQQVAEAATTLSLTVNGGSAASATYGNETNLVFAVSIDSALASGTVTIQTGAITICSATLTDTLTTATGQCSPSSDTQLVPSASAYSVVASYPGDALVGPLTSSPVSVTIDQQPTTTTLSSISPPSPVIYGQESAETFTAGVTPQISGTPTGTIDVDAGATLLCSIVLPATTCSTSDDPLAASATAYSVTASYRGDANYATSVSLPDDLTVAQATTTLTLLVSPATAVVGDESTLQVTATVTAQFAGSPSGTITVTTADSSTLCTIILPDTACPTIGNDLLGASGTPYQISASYPGDTNFTGSTSNTEPLTVNPGNSTTTLSVTPSSSVTYGHEDEATFSATVTASGTPTGTVTISAASTTSGRITLCSYDVTLATGCTTAASTLPASTTPYAVIASYGGDTNFTPSASNPQNFTVQQATTTTSLSPPTSSVAYGGQVMFSSTVTPQFTGAPTGTVTVTSGFVTLCQFDPGTAAGCTANITSLDASATPYSVVATYGGDQNFSGSQTSSPSNLSVDRATTNTSLGAAPSSVAYGSGTPVTFTASVAPAFVGSPTGKVTVTVGAATLCAFTLPSTSCNASLGSRGAGVYTVTASYPGDTNFELSSGTFDVTVGRSSASSPSIANLPAGAAEEGSFTAAVVTNGDGARSVTSDTPGNCTVGSDRVTVRFLVEGVCTLTPHVSSGHNYTGASGSPQTFSIGAGPRGYWLVGSDGGIFSFGTARFHGSMGGIPLQRPVVGITPTSSRDGYWLVASDGGIFAFGDANFFGSIPGVGLHPAGSGLPHSLDAPIVGMVPSHDGGGYFMVASDGGVFAFGDAKFAGSCPGLGGCSGAAVAVMPDASGNGYWLVTSSGAVYAFGDAPFFGAPAPQSTPVVSAVATPDGGGYWILYANGAVLNFGDARPYGGPVGYVNTYNPATSIFPTTDALGYWVASAQGDVFTFGNAPFLGSMSATPLNGPIIAAFGF